MSVLTPKPLTEEDCRDLSPRLRAADLADLTVHRSSPLTALTGALRSPGEAFGVWDGETLIGAGGWTEAGAVWSLWADLTVAQSKALIKMSVPWARIMAIRSKRPLQNVFVKGNHTTARWLRATRCVWIIPDKELTWEGRSYIPFFLKPLEELPYV